jgi:sigma-E factor negative regulatory protein RseB
VYVNGSNLETMQVAHQVDDGIVRERIYSLNGAPREIVRDAEQIWCYVPEQKMGMHEFRQVPKQSFPNILPRRLGQLSDNYALTLGREDRIADRTAQQILIAPRDEYRYGYVLWADRKTGLLLKAALVANENEPVEQYMFTKVSIGDNIDSADLAPNTVKENLKWFGPADGSPRPVNDEILNPGWAVADLPDGFELSRQIKRISPINKRMMEHYVYSDGLAAVSVFIEVLNGVNTTPLIQGTTRIGAVHAFGHTQDGYHVTVVGGVPSRTVDMMATSVKTLLE